MPLLPPKFLSKLGHALPAADIASILFSIYFFLHLITILFLDFIFERCYYRALFIYLDDIDFAICLFLTSFISAIISRVLILSFITSR